jgi:hypothetical protein
MLGLDNHYLAIVALSFRGTQNVPCDFGSTTIHCFTGPSNEHSNGNQIHVQHGNNRVVIVYTTIDITACRLKGNWKTRVGNSVSEIDNKYDNK